jgi:hypothetical protein
MTMSSIGSLIDKAFKLAAVYEAAAEKAEKAKAELTAAQGLVIATLKSQGLDGARGKLGLASLVEEEHPDVDDWEALYKFIVENDAFELLHRRVSRSAWQERLAAGEVIPGVGKFPKTRLSMRRK